MDGEFDKECAEFGACGQFLMAKDGDIKVEDMPEEWKDMYVELENQCVSSVEKKKKSQRT